MILKGNEETQVSFVEDLYLPDSFMSDNIYYVNQSRLMQALLQESILDPK
jgi:hypothetical protein